VQDILHAYSQDEQADKEILLAILKAKTAEDQVCMEFLLLLVDQQRSWAFRELQPLLG
jgi:hypothetical protein